MRKRLVPLFGVLLVMASLAVLAPPKARGDDPTPEEPKSLVVDRVWEEHGTGYALVTYTNTTSRTMASAVTIQCTALDAAGGKINVNHRSFFAHERGAMPPGFSGTLHIPVSLTGMAMKSMSCRITRQN